MPQKPPAAIAWLGGKSPYSGRGVGKWIAEQLPTDTSTYAEPFAGMLGVLRQRQPVALEIVNDIHGELMNWWQAVRDHSEELHKLLDSTPNSQELFYSLRDTPPEEFLRWSCVKRAWRFSVLALLSHSANLTAWQALWKPEQPSGKGRKSRIATFSQNLPALADRVRHVHVHNTNAETILEQLADNADCLIYADPPYPSSVGKATYEHSQVDAETLMCLFAKQKGFVAISGYPQDPWNELGWRYEDLSDYCKLDSKPDITERLWMNYPPVAKSTLW